MLGGGETLVVSGSVGPGPDRQTRMVRAYDAASGEVLWTVDLPGDGLSSLALVGDRVIATHGTTLFELA